MDLQDMKGLWAEYDRKLETSLRLNTSILREMSMNKVDSSLKRLSRLLVFELVQDLAAVVLLGMFIASHFGEMRFLVPALLLDVCAISFLIRSVRQLVTLHSLDYSAPVLEIQKHLAELRVQRIRVTKWVLLLCPLLWTPLMIVTFEGLFGVDAYLFLDGTWLAANLVIGLAFIPLMLWAARHAAGRWQGSPLFQSLMDDLAGRSLVTATGFLNDLSRFENEEA